MSRTNNGEIAGKRGCLMGRPRSYVREEDEAMEQNEQDPPRNGNGVYSRPSRGRSRTASGSAFFSPMNALTSRLGR